MRRSICKISGWFLAWSWVFGCITFMVPSSRVSGAENEAVTQFRKNIQPLLETYCYDCHADGENKGGVAFDKFNPQANPADSRDLWLKALKNLRSGMMPPAKIKERPTASEQQLITKWIKADEFGIDPKNPDPGKVTVRRLNRVEYHNTIRDLIGVDYDTQVEFPPDDTGNGFDTIGDVLSISPLLLEKYMHAAETIAAGAVPRAGRVVAEKTISGGAFKPVKGTNTGERISFYSETIVTNS